MSVKRYAMLHAAMAAMAYDGNIVDDNYTTPDTDADAYTQSLGLKDKFSFSNLSALQVINFYLPFDSALHQWRLNNALFKPQFTVLDGVDKWHYHYEPNWPTTMKLYCSKGSGENRPIRIIGGLPEALSYVTQSRSAAAGANGNTNGSVDEKVRMDEEYSFGTMHSAEWVLPLQKTIEMWRELMRQFEITTNASE